MLTKIRWISRRFVRRCFLILISLLSLINSAAKKNPGASQPREPPFGTDSMSAWERDDNSSNGKEKNNNEQHIQIEKLQASNQCHETSKFKRMKATTPMNNDLESSQPGDDKTKGHISQIPGLSPSISSRTEEKIRGRRRGVTESDSDFIKLAKQGGHKGLLWHEDPITSEPTSYKPPNWFSASGGITPSLIHSAAKKNPGASQPREPPFGTDSMSAWERDDNSSNGKEKNNNEQHIQTEKMQASNQCHEPSKFKRIVHDKKPSPVNMSKLLSFGYVEENKPTTSSTDQTN